MTIKQPHIFKHGLFRREHIRLLTNFADQYNEGKTNGEMLKGEHIGLLDELIYYAQIRINTSTTALGKEDSDLPSMESGTWIKVNLSKFLIAQKLENRRHPDTVKRWKRRLVESGAIVTDPRKFESLKIARSHRNDVLINPDLVLIYDLDNSDFTPFTKYFSEADKQDIWKEKWTDCMTVSGKGTLPDSISNEIMPVDTVEKGVSLAVDEKQINHPNTTKPDATPKQDAEIDTAKENDQENTLPRCENSQNQNENKNKGAGGGRAPGEKENFEEILLKKQDKMAELRRPLAIELYTFMVQMLFKNHNIFPGEAYKAIAYLQEKYFGHVESKAQGDYAMKVYKWRVSKAAQYINNHTFNFSNIYPVKYLNVHYEYGFAATKIWYNNHMEAQERKKKERIEQYEKLAQERILKEAMEEYRQYPTVETFNRHKKNLGENQPELLNIFMQQVSQFNHNI